LTRFAPRSPKTRLFFAFGQECIDNWPVGNVDLDRLDLWRTDARNALDALGGPIARTQYIRTAEANDAT
jgi:hypothetical protein